MRKNNKGFTLVELLAVIVVLAIVATIVVTSAYSLVKSNRDEQYSILISEIEQATKLYLNDNFENYVIGKEYNSLAIKFLADNSCDKTYIQLKTLVDNNYIKESVLVDPRDSRNIDTNKYVYVYYDNSTLTISDTLVSSPSLVCSGVALNASGGYYTVSTPNNFVMFNNQLFRIIRVNKDGSIKLLMDSDIGSSVFGSNGTYQSSYVLASAQYWYIYDVASVAKELSREASVGLISDVEYNTLDSSQKTDTEFWIVKDNTTGITNKKSSDIEYLTYSAAIKPTIELKPNVYYVLGSGTINNPYTIR